MNDLGENAERLRQVAGMAQPGDLLVDLGVRTGTSSQIMLEATHAQQCYVFGVDPAPQAFWPEEMHRYYYWQRPSTDAANLFKDASVHLACLDTLHIKEQVMAELYHYWPKIKVGGWAVIHDTEWPADKHDEYLGRKWAHAGEGVKAFFGPPNPHILYAHHPESWGMDFVQKFDDWMPEVSGIEDALNASRELTRAVCGV